MDHVHLCVFSDEVDFSPLVKLLPPTTRIKCVSLSEAQVKYRTFEVLRTTFFLSDPTQLLKWRVFTDYYELEDSIDRSRKFKIIRLSGQWPRGGLEVEKCLDHTLACLFDTKAEQNYLLTEHPTTCQQIRAFSDTDTVLRFLHYRWDYDVDYSVFSTFKNLARGCSCGRCSDPTTGPLDQKELRKEFRTPLKRSDLVWDISCSKCTQVRNVRTNEAFALCSFCKNHAHKECFGLVDMPPEGWVCRRCTDSPAYWKHLRSLNPDPWPFVPVQLPPELAHLATVPQWAVRPHRTNWWRLIVTEHVIYKTLPRERADVVHKQMFFKPESLFGRPGFNAPSEMVSKLWLACPDKVAIKKEYHAPEAAYLVGWNSGHLLRLSETCGACLEKIELNGLPIWFYPSEGWIYCTKCYPVGEHRLITYPSQAKVDAYLKTPKS